MAYLYLLVIIVTLFGVAIGRYPWLRMNRATIAFCGAVLLIVIRAISLEQAYAAVDLNTIVLLFAMMVLNVNLRLAGFFRLVTDWVIRWAHTPRQLLGWVILTAGMLSALFLNDTIVLMFTPLTLEITTTLKRNPIPYLIGLVTAANIGSVATITGNPQNMLIGMSANIPYLTFTQSLAPIALLGLGVVWITLVWLYPAEFNTAPFTQMIRLPPRTYRPLLRKSLLATGIMLIGFIWGAPIPLAALSAAAVLLITRRLKPARVFQELDWSLLVFFCGLFVVTGAIETAGFSRALFAAVEPVARSGLVAFTSVSVVLSNLISNVPAVMLFRPLIPNFPNAQQVWLALAMATTLAGNLTLLGSVANLIVAELARERGVNLTFMEYLKAGVPITVTSLAIGVFWLSIFG